MFPPATAPEPTQRTKKRPVSTRRPPPLRLLTAIIHVLSLSLLPRVAFFLLSLFFEDGGASMIWTPARQPLRSEKRSVVEGDFYFGSPSFNEAFFPFPPALGDDRRAPPPGHAAIPACKSSFLGPYIRSTIPWVPGGGAISLPPTEGIISLTPFR